MGCKVQGAHERYSLKDVSAWLTGSCQPGHMDQA
jgi:hypothetical protein